MAATLLYAAPGSEREPEYRGKASRLSERLSMDVRPIIMLGEIAFEVAGVAILIVGSLISLMRSAADLVHRQPATKVYRSLRHGLARAILLGLEFLVAADIIRSVALEPTFQSVGVLGLIVLVRTFLSWSLEVEITGDWPWHRASRVAEGAASARDDIGEL
jgi:uncharacterized membrane protein